MFPGAAYLEMALSAGATALKTPHVRLRSVALLRSLPLCDSPQTLQTILTPEAEGYRFEIYSRPDGRDSQEDWTLHCEGAIALAEPAAPDPLDVEALKQTRPKTWSAAEHYRRGEQRGLRYSGPFRTVEAIWRSEGAALGQIQSPAVAADSAPYHLHPALLDACFQGVLAALPEGTDLYVPIGVDCLRRYRPLPEVGATLWSDVRLRGDGVQGAAVVTADVRIATAAGELVALASGLSAKRIEQIEPSRSQVAPQVDWLYRVSWQPAPRSTGGSAGPWLVISDSPEGLEAIASKLTAKGQTYATALLPADASGSAAFKALLTQQPDLQGVVYCSGLAAPTGYGHRLSGTLSDEVSKTCQGALHLVQALVQGGPPTPRLWLVTCGAQAVLGHEPLAVAQSTLWGLGKTIALEHPELRTVCLDLDPDCSDRQRLNELAAELALEPGADGQLAHRQGDRYRAKLIGGVPLAAPALNETVTRQLQIAARGTLDHLVWKSVPRRSPQINEVEIRVQAAGLNFRDVLNALDLYPGAGALGLECVGEIVAVGAGVSGVRLGEAVMAIAPASFSQYVTVAAELVVPKPAALAPEEAATIPTAFLTAYYALCRLGQLFERQPPGKVKRALIHAAAGGVGQAAVQLAQQAGVEVFATASQPKWNFLRQQGVRRLFDSRSLDFAAEILEQTGGAGVDVVLNSLSDEAIPKSLSTLTEGGCFLEIGKKGIWPVERMVQQRPDVAYHIIDLVVVTQEQPRLIQSMLRHLTEQLQAGNLHPLPLRAFPAGQATAAFRWMQQAKHRGKVVITPPRPAAPIRNEATYLITGGLGALGLQVARWLIERGARHLALLGRQPPSPEARRSIQQLEAEATVSVLQADVAEISALEAALLQLSDGPPLKGVFHLAGQLDDGVLLQQTWQRFEGVMAPKVLGTWHLHQLTRSLALDHFVMFSSAASLLGSAGQANYAAANAFLDAIAHLRHQQGLPALSINWGAWDGIGLAANSTVAQRLARSREKPLPPPEGLAILEHLMAAAGMAQVGVLPGQPFKASSPEAAKRVGSAADNTAANVADNVTFRTAARIQAAEPSQRPALIADYLRHQVAVVLGVNGALDPNSGFTDLGLDSLTAVELRNRLQADLGCALPATLSYDYPTLASLEKYLLSRIVDPEDSFTAAPLSRGVSKQPSQVDLDRLSEAEAEALLLETLDHLENQ